MSQFLTFAVVAAVAFTASARPHYDDPNQFFGCLSDEVKATITGVAGNLCIPACYSNGTCPMDKPANVQGTPKCVLTSNTGEKFCAMTCDADQKQCGPKASCKKATDDSLCTFDDAPKPPSSKHWVPVDSPTFRQQAVCLAVGFTEDGVTGYAGGGTSNSGAQIIKTTDSGVTWDVIPAKQAFNIFLDVAVASEQSAVVSGVIEQEHTVDGKSFIGGGPYLCPAEDIGILPDSKEFALVGECANGNEVALSQRGAVYTAKPIPTSILNQTFQLVRFGAFPSEKTWYVSAGTFPTTPSPSPMKGNKNSTHKRVTHRVTVSEKDYSFEDHTNDVPPVDCSVDPTNCFSGAIVKTTDGGDTWTKVWENVNTGDNIYNNGIHCISETHCVAAMEGLKSQIMVTRDGGRTWKVTHEADDPASSLIAVRMLDENEVWVSGGEMKNSFAGEFWHSLDGGDTWTVESIRGLYIFSFDMVSRQSGYAVALTQASGVSLLKYRDPSKVKEEEKVQELRFIE